MEQPYTPAQVELLLYEAGETLMALRVPGYWPAGFRSSMPEMLREAIAEYGYVRAEYTIPVPSPARISAMDRALPWVGILPGGTEEETRLRHLVCARCLVNPRTRLPLYSWKRLGHLAGCSENTAKSRWIGAVGRITAALNRPGLCALAGGPVGLRRDASLWLRPAGARAAQARKIGAERKFEPA